MTTSTEEKTSIDGGTRKILYLNLFTMGISYIIFSAIIPFVSIELTECGLSPSFIGTITAAYPFGMVISSVLAGYLLPILGTKNVLLAGIALAAISALLFGSVPAFTCDLDEGTDEQSGALLSFILFLIFRMIEGFAAGAIETSVIFCNSDLFADSLGQVMAYQELSVGFACMFGPLIGGIIYDLVGFFWTFASFSVLNGVLIIVLMIFFPRNYQKASYEEAETLSLLDPEINKKETKTKEVDDFLFDDVTEYGILDVMSFPLLISFITLFLFNLFFTFMMPFLPLYTLEKFGWGATVSGASVACCALCYAISSFVVGYTVDELKIACTGKFKIAYGIGFLMTAISYWLLGPYPVTDFLVSQTSFLIAMGFLGLASGFVAIPTLPDAQLCAEKVTEDSKEIKSLVSGVWQATYASAAVIAGPLSGVIYGQWGFVGLNLISSLISVFMVFVTFILGFYWTKSDPFQKKNI